MEKKKILFEGVTIYNKLQNDIRESKTITTFNDYLLKKYLIIY